MSAVHRSFLPGALAVFLAPLLSAGSDLRIDIQPRTGTTSDLFRITISNDGPEDFVFDDCCTVPKIISLRDGSDAYCPNCPKKPCVPESGLLPAGESLEFAWSPSPLS